MIKNFKVSMEFNVKSTDFADVMISAESEDEARKIALEMYNAEELPELDLYAGGDAYYTELDTETKWLCEEVAPEVANPKKQVMDYSHPEKKVEKTSKVLENKVLLAVLFSGNCPEETETEVVYDYTNNLSVGSTYINDGVYSTIGYSKKLEGTTDLYDLYYRVIKKDNNEHAEVQDREGVIIDGEYYFN